jgi:hypothetical protein
MDEKQEVRRRRQAIRLWLKGLAPKNILKKIGRSRVWLSKWQTRFTQQGLPGLHSRSREAQHHPAAYSAWVVRLIIRTRRRLVKQKVGLIGARAIQREVRKVLKHQTPSLATIKRILRAHHLGTAPTEPPAAYFPKPLMTVAGSLHAMDWTCRYLEAGIKIYAFHTLNLRTRACTQTIAADKSRDTVIQHCVDTWKTLGLPQFLQLDNDAAFCGGYKTPRVFGQLVRLCLYGGIELIFLPIAEPECNGEVEELNGLWAHTFWERRRVTSIGHVRRASPEFLHWYLTDYAPPWLTPLTPEQAQRREATYRVRAAWLRRLPERLPLTAGRLHFIRTVKPDGTISILNETWKVSKRLSGQYVWATITTHRRRLDIWYQRSAQHDWRLLKTCPYDIPERVAHLKPEFVRAKLA